LTERDGSTIFHSLSLTLNAVFCALLFTRSDALAFSLSAPKISTAPIISAKRTKQPTMKTLKKRPG
jgi:hypothetical protein